MFFFLSKILAFIITPLIWVFGLLIYSFVNKDRKRKISLGIALIILFIFSNSFIFNESMKAWEYPAIKTSELKGTYDAAIVLGGISFYDSDLDRVQFNRSVDRLTQAVSLYKQGIVKKIFFTGGSGSISFSDMKEAPWVKRYLITLGIPEQDILIEQESRNTRENAVLSAPILEQNFGKGKFILITSAFHMRRGMGCFKKAGIEVTPFSADRFSGPTRFQPDYLIVPSSEVISSWSLLIHEMIGYLVYSVSGYV